MGGYLLAALALLVLFRGAMAYSGRRNAIITDGDAAVHLALVRQYQRGGGKTPDASGIYILEGTGYPTGFHKLFYLLRVPVAWLERYGYCLPLCFDALLLCLAALAVRLFGGEHYAWLLAFPFMRMFFGHEGRAQHFSERAYGVLWGNAYLLCVAAFFLTGQAWWLAPGFAALLIVSISSKFSLQAACFFSAALSLATLNVTFALAFALMLAGAFAASGGYALRTLKATLHFLYYYRLHTAPRNPLLRRDCYRELLRFQGAAHSIYMLFSNAPLRVFTDSPLMPVLLWAGWAQGADDFWFRWVLCGVALTLLTALKPLKFVGQPERYLEFTIIPLLVYLSQVPVLAYPLPLLLSFLTLLAVALFHVTMHRRTMRAAPARHADMLALRDFFSSIRHATVLTIPFRVSLFLGYANEDNRFLAIFSTWGKGEKAQNYRWLMPDLSLYVRKDLQSVIDKFGVDYIVVQKQSVESAKRFLGDYYDFTPYETVYDNPHYMVLRVAAA